MGEESCTPGRGARPVPRSTPQTRRPAPGKPRPLMGSAAPGSGHPALIAVSCPAVSADPRVELTEVSLCYRLAKERIRSFKEYAIHFLKGALIYEQLWALRDVSLHVEAGGTGGIVGVK